MSRIAKGPLDSLFKNKRSRTIAKGDGLGLRLVLQRKAVELDVGALFGFARPENTVMLNSIDMTPHIAVRSFERLAKDYGCHSKRIARYPRASKFKSNDSGN
jgi:hypothetical protein